MPGHVLHEPADFSFEKVGIKGKIFPATQLSKRLNVLLVTTDTGHETTIRQRESDFAYYILEGSGYFEINRVKENCGARDLIIIPAGESFTYQGKFKFLLVNTPPWQEEQEETLQ